MNDPSHDIIARFTGELVRRVLEALGENRVLSVFVGGSVAAEEASYCVDGARVDIYSDVDLYAVVADGVALDEARSKVGDAMSGLKLEGEGYRFLRGPDVGVYDFANLAAQPARPGTAGLDKQHIVLHGDPDIPRRAGEQIGDRIVAAEALYLLENRLIELASIEDDRGDGGRLRAFTVCKTGLDVATAALIVAGRYHPRRSERLQRVATLAEAPDAGWSGERLGVVRACGERLDRMPSRDWADGLDTDEMTESVVAIALDEWKRIAAGTLQAKPDDWGDLVLRRCHAGDYIGNFRQFRALNARCGFIRRGAIGARVHVSRHSPVDALRLSALVDYLSRGTPLQPDVARLAQTLGPYLDRLTHECGFTKGSLSERAREMHHAAR